MAASPAMFCQKCRTPLRIDGSLQDLNPAAFKLLTDASGLAIPPQSSTSSTLEAKSRLEEYHRVSQNAQTPSFKQSTQSISSNNARDQNPSMSFVMLSQSQMADTIANLASPSASPSRARRKEATSRDPPDRLDVQPKRANQAGTQTFESADRLFEILSARSDIDHPVCVECTELLVDGLQKRLQSATKERDSYVEFLRHAHADVPTAEDLSTAQDKLNTLRKQEAAAFAELEALEREKAALDDELSVLEAESLSLADEEAVFWAERNAFSARLALYQKEREALAQKLEHDTKQLERLQRANVYNDTFSIGHDNNFATINGLRLGRLPDRPVEWAEINAAWGYTCLLLTTVAEKLRFRFVGFELIPMGSVSRIKSISSLSSTADSVAGSGIAASRPSSSRAAASSANNSPAKIRTLDLYHPTSSAGAFPMAVPGFYNRKFDAGMVAFLTCLAQIIDFVGAHKFPSATPSSASKVEQMDTPTFPYQIVKDRINDCSIKLGAGFGGMGAIVGGGGARAGEEEWTRACKAVLISCKILIAFASNVGDGGPIA